MSRIPRQHCVGDRHGDQYGDRLTIPVGTYPFGVAVTPDGSKVYVVNSATTPFGDRHRDQHGDGPRSRSAHPVGIAVTPDGSKVYVANSAFSPTRCR